MKSRILGLSAPLLFVLLACTSAATSTPAPSPSEAPRAQTSQLAPSDPHASAAKAIGALRTRDHHVTLFASPSGVLVTVRAHDGAILADRVDVESLRESEPALYRVCRSAIAADPAYLDATLDHVPPRDARDAFDPFGKR